MDFITDTYSLLWYFTEDPRLSKKAGIAMLMGALSLHPSYTTVKEIDGKIRKVE